MRHIWFSYSLSYPRSRVNAGNQLKLKRANKTKQATVNTKKKIEREADYFELSSAL